jgi:hypothetical protein
MRVTKLCIWPPVAMMGHTLLGTEIQTGVGDGWVEERVEKRINCADLSTANRVGKWTAWSLGSKTDRKVDEMNNRVSERSS